MNALAKIGSAASLPALVDRAAAALTSARTSAEVLEARDMASVAYDTAKTAARIARAKEAHDDLLAAVYRAQADALEIEAGAKRRLADEYDAAQRRGEVEKGGRPKTVPDGNGLATAADLGLSRKDVHEARLIRDAERASPGIVKQTLKAAIDAGDEPSRANLRRATAKIARPKLIPPREEQKIAIAERIAAALSALASLPSPETAARDVHGTKPAATIKAKVGKAEAWLSRFAAEWKEIEEC